MHRAVAGLAAVVLLAAGCGAVHHPPLPRPTPSTTTTAVTIDPGAPPITDPPTTTTGPPAPTISTQILPATRPAPGTARQTVPTADPTAAPPSGSVDHCPAELAYLAAHAAPGYALYCRPYPLPAVPAFLPRNAVGFTCYEVNRPGLCPDDQPEIVVGDLGCPQVTANEAWNSQHLNKATGQFTGPIDPYGLCLILGG